MNLGTRRILLLICVVMLSVLAAPRAVYESWRLLAGPTWFDATDIKQFHNQILVWRSGQDLYATMRVANYPPASYPLMAPMYVLDNHINRPLFFVHTILVLALLI